MQVHGAVAVQDALGIAGGAGCIANGAGFFFVQFGPLIRRAGRGGEQGFVVEWVLMGCVTEDDDFFDAWDLALQTFQNRQQRGVGEDHFVARVVDDVGELVIRQAEIQSVQDAAGGGHGEVEFEVAMRVPAERADAVATLQAELREDVPEAVRAGVEIRVGVAMDVVGELAGQLALGEEAGDTLEDGRDGERIVHHQSC